MFEFPPFRLDTVNLCLLRKTTEADYTRIPLPPTGFAVLRYLVEHAERLVTQEELLDAVWPDTFVEPQAVKRQVFAIRKALSDHPKTPAFIETRQGRGYQFIAPVSAYRAERAQPQHNLPEPLSSFIGRAKETQAIRTLMSRSRLVTLTGAGGCGKTRLALRVAQDVQDRFVDGTWFCELASLANPANVVPLVASILGVRERSGESLVDTIAANLSTRTALLVLDNAEHVLPACASLVEALLRRSPGLTILVTSRERLAVLGEATYRVPSLSVPSERETSVEAVAANDAIALFVARARLARPHFAITEQNAATAASICRRLDGIPLAIELAAARIRSMSVEEIGRRLDRRFSLLANGARSALPRQRTLRSLIDWSFDLLADAERSLLSGVSVFAGGWTLDAAEWVCEDVGLPPDDVLEVLTGLIDKNLIFADEQDGITRYGVLETIREYARDVLKGTARESELRARHFAYFVQLSDLAEEGYRVDNDLATWLARLVPERDNVELALSWSVTDVSSAEAGLRLASTFSRFWETQGFVTQGRDWFRKLLPNLPQARPGAVSALALGRAAELARRQGDYVEAEALADRSLDMRRQLGDPRGIVSALRGRAAIAFNRGDFVTAQAICRENVETLRRLGDLPSLARELCNLGISSQSVGDFVEARSCYEECMAIRTTVVGFVDWYPMLNRGVLAYEMGEYVEARSWLSKAMVEARRVGNQGGVSLTANNLGMVALAEGDRFEARTLSRQALRIQWELKDLWAMCWSLEGVANTFADEDPPRAARIWGKAAHLRMELKSALPRGFLTAHEQRVAALRARTGDAVFGAAWRTGEESSLEDIVHVAIDET